MRVLALALVLAALPAWAEEDDAARAARWQDLRHMVLNDRAVADGKGIVSMDAPDRALDAALVPITIHMTGKDLKSLTLIIDNNPAPVAGTFHFGPAADTREIRTRVRVDDYTLIHAVVETADGKLYGAEKFVKASGGCSAPAGGDPTVALSRLGQMKMKAALDGPKGAEQVQLLISHPNYNGMQMDQVTRLYTPARFVQDVKVSQGDRLVFDLASDISLSEDPAITFGVAAKGAEPVTVDMSDSTGAKFHQTFDLPAAAIN
ncbi:MAG TPA: quinoprotein dehydrogenase-associated SoxYZ-like carrier [Stellaceae bacterium]|nr:quinoprotein dehydrogenase-associated SoxYZ-like carrier [Stellaceae bacterium]